MKHPCIASIAGACAPCLMIAAALLAGAQTPAHAGKAPSSAPAAAAPASASPSAPAPAQPAAPQPPAPQPATPNPEQAGYLFGLTFGEQMHHVGITDQVSIEAIARGLKDGLHGKKSTPPEQQQLNAFVHTQMEAAVAHNQDAAKTFLEHNAHEKGVTTTASGLQYKIMAPGDPKAAPITPTDQVTVQYRGTLLDGTEFDSSFARGTPATFPVNGVIPGWQEALVLMKPGAKWQLFVPPELAYRNTPKGAIPGGSLLKFDVEVLSVKASAAPPVPAVKMAPPVKPTPTVN